MLAEASSCFHRVKECFLIMNTGEVKETRTFPSLSDSLQLLLKKLFKSGSKEPEGGFCYGEIEPVYQYSQGDTFNQERKLDEMIVDHSQRRKKIYH